MAAAYIQRVVVKFRDSAELPYEDGVEKHFEKPEIGLWEALREQFPGITVNRLYTSLTPEEIQRLVNQAVERDRTYHPPNFSTDFAVEFPPGVDPEALAKALATWPSVQLAYAEGRLGPPPAVNAANDPRSASQGYLGAAPAGIDARFAWAKVDPGGAGEQVGFVDMEQGWTLNHQDLTAAGVTLISGLNQDHFPHGTSVLGIVMAMDSTIGSVGIARHARARVISEWRPTGKYNRADAVMAAVGAMNPGDVLLVETQFWPADGSRGPATDHAVGPAPLPAELRAAVFNSIRLGTALGIVIVEPAGNGWRNLDDVTDADGRQVLNRLSPDFQDSGAIVVGAASSTVPHFRLRPSSYGSRVDCYAWGDSVGTLTTDPTGAATDRYTGCFGGTSAASAIVAGAALIVQSVAQTQLGCRLSPQQLRTVLSDPATGTASSDPAVDRIGVMPNLRNILQNVLSVTPAV